MSTITATVTKTKKAKKAKISSFAGTANIKKIDSRLYVELNDDIVAHLQLNAKSPVYWVLTNGTVQLSVDSPKITIPIFTDTNHQFISQ